MLYCELSLKIINDFEIVEHGKKTAFWFVFNRSENFLVPHRSAASGVHENQCWIYCFVLCCLDLADCIESSLTSAMQRPQIALKQAQMNGKVALHKHLDS